MPNWTPTPVRPDGEYLDSAKYQADRAQAAAADVPTVQDDYSADLAEMQTVADPAPSGTPSLATTLAGELARLRYVLTQMKLALGASITHWYEPLPPGSGGGGGADEVVVAASAPTVTGGLPELWVDTASSGGGGGGGGGVTFLPTGQCRLDFTSATVLTLSRKDGAYLPLKVGGAWTATVIPAAGVTLANTGLTAATLYYVYAYDNAGTLTLEASATAPAVDADTGVRIKTGDPTRTLVGMAYMGPGTPGTFVESATQRLVASFYNRRGRGLVNGFTTPRPTGSASYVEINAEIRCEFLTWDDELVRVGANVSVRHDATHGFVSTAIAFDGTTAEDASAQDQIYTATGEGASGLALMKAGLTVGRHYATLLGAAPAGGTATWQGSAVGALGAATARCSLTVEARG